MDDTSPQPGRARAALERMLALYEEQQAIYRATHPRHARLTEADEMRLAQIHRELAHVQDERNRARCGAPPAPPDYDPLCDPLEEPAPPMGGRRPNGNNARLFPDEVAEIRHLFLCGLRVVDIRRQHFAHLGETTVRDIVRNRTWHDPDYPV